MSSRAETASLWLNESSQHIPALSTKGHGEEGLPPRSEAEDQLVHLYRLETKSSASLMTLTDV